MHDFQILVILIISGLILDQFFFKKNFFISQFNVLKISKSIYCFVKCIPAEKKRILFYLFLFFILNWVQLLSHYGIKGLETQMGYKPPAFHYEECHLKQTGCDLELYSFFKDFPGKHSKEKINSLLKKGYTMDRCPFGGGAFYINEQCKIECRLHGMGLRNDAYAEFIEREKS